MKNKLAALAARESSVSEKTRNFHFIDSSGEFLPGGSYLPGFVAKYLYVMIKYCKKKFFLEKERNALEHSILQGYLIPGIPIIGIEVAGRHLKSCEEFDDYGPVKERDVYEAGFQPAQSRVGPGTMEKDSSQFKGLCINSKTEGGIRHCEEYC